MFGNCKLQDSIIIEQWPLFYFSLIFFLLFNPHSTRNITCMLGKIFDRSRVEQVENLNHIQHKRFSRYLCDNRLTSPGSGW